MCDIFVNSQKLTDEKLKLTTLQNYEINFGSLTKDRNSLPIGYSIDVECAAVTNITISKKVHSFDIDNVPIEIDYINCGDLTPFFLKNIQFTDKNKRNYLTVFVDFNELNEKSVEIIKMKMNLNRRLGDGCLNHLTFYAKLTESNFLDKLLEDLACFWKKLTSNKICVYLLAIIGIFIFVFIMLITLLCVKIGCCSRRSKKSVLRINKTLDRKLSNKKRDFSKLEASSRPTNENFQMDNEKRHEVEKLAVTPIVEENEFQILRRQLLSNMRNNNDNYENIINNYKSKY